MCPAKFIVNPTFVFLILVSGQWNDATAEVFEGVGRYYQDRNTTWEEACHRALQKSKQDVFSKAGLEKFTSANRETCSEIGEQVECELYQDTLNTYSGGYITGYDKIESKIDSEHGAECEIRIQANVKKYVEKSDPNLTLNVVLNEDIFRSDDVLLVSGEVSQPVYLYFLGWYPDFDPEHYHGIGEKHFPNNKVSGKFTFPDQSRKVDFDLIMKFPPDLKDDTTFEFIIILASKVKIPILEEERISSFRARLDTIGRDQWTETSVGYKIVNKTRKES